MGSDPTVSMTALSRRLMGGDVAAELDAALVIRSVELGAQTTRADSGPSGPVYGKADQNPRHARTRLSGAFADLRSLPPSRTGRTDPTPQERSEPHVANIRKAMANEVADACAHPPQVGAEPLPGPAHTCVEQAEERQPRERGRTKIAARPVASWRPSTRRRKQQNPIAST